ncbi:GroES-like protein [Penicillium cosmopolitanum]|uniref:GroES-like protein n=1 Tax=Penicillium cosmopolitanum TaxID=1131564 RepID=A0A9W9VGG2_9EURO|nr:GroES-like protein [Penicillium cosmopolitanum]KAJ5378461.1 GroES-like protein [Penicillium cosmopolitanum]
MSSILRSPNTGVTPDQAGCWVVTEFGIPSMLQWKPWYQIPELSADKVLVRIIVAGIAGVDNIQRAGGYPHPDTIKPGFTPGYDFVGEIVAFGESVPQDIQLAPGDRVVSLCTTGAHATHIVISYTKLIRIERTDDPLKVASLPLNYMTAWGLLNRSGVQLKPGSSILIGSASGGIGTAVAQLVTAFDMKIKMIGTCSPSKFDYLRSLGVEPVDRNAPDLVKQVRALANEGVDVAYDGVCSEDSLQKSLSATKDNIGRVVVFGIMSEIAADGSAMQHSVAETLAARLQPRMSFGGIGSGFPTFHGASLVEFKAILEKVRRNKLTPSIAKLFPLRDAVEAHEHLVSGTAVKGKMLFLVDPDLAIQYGVAKTSDRTCRGIHEQN